MEPTDVTDDCTSCLCTHDGRADFWLETQPGMSDMQMGASFAFSLLRGFSRLMKGRPLGGTSCDISENSILAIAGKARGVAVGPTIYAANACAAPGHACCSSA